MRCLLLFALVGLALIVNPVGQSYASNIQGEVLPRTIIAIYDNANEGDPRYTLIHRFLEMPLNHLGFKLKYHDVNEPLPDIGSDVHGVIVWLLEPENFHEAMPLINWLHGALDKKKKLLVMNTLTLSEKFREASGNLNELNRLMHRVGVHDNDTWVNITHNVKILSQNKEITNFERKYEGEIKPFMVTQMVGPSAKSHLRVKVPYESDGVADLVVTNDNGGYVALGYGVFRLHDKEGKVLLNQWFLNPFLFLSEVFDDGFLPKADTTTILGNRIFYSHLDGDGWNNLSEVEGYKGKRVLSSEVLYEEVFSVYDQLGFTIGLIVSELRPDCYGVPDSIDVAKKVLGLSNIEAGSHSYSHPLYWAFFADADPDKEEPYLSRYPRRPNKRFFLSDMILEGQEDEIKADNDYASVVADEDPLEGIFDPYTTLEDAIQKLDTPRSYACEPFNLNKEIQGSIDYINQLNPEKPVKIMQWTGNTSPFQAAIRKTREAGLPNINGGDSRFDVEYPSYASVSSLGVQVGDEQQIYSSNSNENTYTDLWTDRFYGFRYLQTTVDNTETPVRIDPFNVYFHTYSGENQAGLNAVKENLNYALTKDIIPIFTSNFSLIAEGFYQANFIKLGKEHWRMVDRGQLNTVRIDDALLKQVDFAKSKGVIGQSFLHGSLYIALDPAQKMPEIALKDRKTIGFSQDTKIPYIVKSNWQINNLQFSKESLTFDAQGFGKSNILVQLPKHTEAKLQLLDGDTLLKEQKLQLDVYNRAVISVDKRKESATIRLLLGKK